MRQYRVAFDAYCALSDIHVIQTAAAQRAATPLFRWRMFVPPLLAVVWGARRHDTMIERLRKQQKSVQQRPCAYACWHVWRRPRHEPSSNRPPIPFHGVMPSRYAALISAQSHAADMRCCLPPDFVDVIIGVCDAHAASNMIRQRARPARGGAMREAFIKDAGC